MSARPPKSGSRVAQYRLGRELARGGTASVYECFREPDGTRLAIKVLSAGLRDNAGSLARLLQEGRAIRALRHERIVQVYDHGTTPDGTGYVVMELLDGRAIDQDLALNGPFAPNRAAFVGRQICEALAAAHARSVIHRDIKPANIMLVEGQRHGDFVKLLDFGVARLPVDDPARLAQTAQGMTLGTPQYMSPEQAQALPVDGRTDIYNTGLVLYEMLVGSPPFDDDNPVKVMRRHLIEVPPLVRAARPDVPAALEQIISRCLAKEPSDRYPTAEALGRALDRTTRDSFGTGKISTLVPGKVTTTADLQLPTLGNPGDLDRYAESLKGALDALWPDGDAPQRLRTLQQTLADLSERANAVDRRVAERRVAAGQVAHEIELALRPLERAIEALELERVALENSQAELSLREAKTQALVKDLDAAYAVIYGQVETHQSKLFARAGQDGGKVDFRDLFREDVEAQLTRLSGIFAERAQAASALSAVQARQADLLPRIADVRLQLHELQRSRLKVEARRVSELARLEFEVTAAEGEQHGLARAREHRTLELGLAFRRAVSDLIDARDRRSD